MASARGSAEDFNDLPESMRRARRWLVWREQPTADQRKPRKVPYYVSGKPRSGSLDSAEDIAQLGTFEQAIAILPAFTGLGFALGPDGTGNCWQGVDLDDLPGHPELQLLAEEAPGYTETSPSGRGIHAIGYGRPFAALGSNGTGIEAYSSGRYFTVTADNAGLGEPCDLSNWINSALRPRHSVRPVTTASVAPAVPSATLAELRSALLSMRADDRDLWVANGQRLKKLGDPGRALWLEWSATSEKFDPADAARVWDSLSGDHTGYAAVFAAAQAQGWVNPLSSAPSNPAARVAAAAPVLMPLPLHDLMQAELIPPSFVIAPYVPTGVVTLLGGHGGIGKSMLGLTLAAHVAAGRPWAFTAVDAPGRAVFLSFEDSGDIVRYRLRRLIEQYDLPLDPTLANLDIYDGTELDAELMRETPHGDLQETPTLAAVEQACAQAKLIMIDNASDVYGGAENVRAQVRKFIRRLAGIARANQAGLVLLVHIDKSAAKNGAQGNSYSGSTAWHNSARSRLALIQTDAGSIELHQEKLNLGKKAEPVLLEHAPHGVLVPQAAATPRMAAAATAATDADVVAALLAEAARSGAIVPTATTGPNQAGHALAQLPGTPAWALTKDGRRRIHTALVRLQMEGRAVRVPYKKADRHPGERWELPQEAPDAR